MRLSMLNDVRNKIEVNRILIELINKLCTIKGNYWNNFSENYLLINNINENYYCYFVLIGWILVILKFFYKQKIFI